MELGNMIFGNSRGEFSVNRDWQDGFCEFLDECNIDGYGFYDGDDQYQTNSGGFENDVFLVNPYDWDAHCTCGFEELDFEWWRANKHTDNCFSVRLKNYEEELESKGFEYLSDKYIELVDKWAKENGWEHGWSGCASHCDCGVYARYDEWVKDKGHKDYCRLVQPNFLYKPTGFQIRWYKYPLRDSYMNQNITFEELKKIMEDCKHSIKCRI